MSDFLVTALPNGATRVDVFSGQSIFIENGSGSLTVSAGYWGILYADGHALEGRIVPRYFEHDLKAHLQASAAVSNVVGEKIFPEVIPQGVNVPAIVYTVVFGEPRNSLDGFTSGLVNYQVQVDCWCATYEQALALAHAVRDQVNTAYATFKTVIREFPGQSDYEDQTKRYRRMLQLSCWHHE